jgi:TRAP-type C4-dicarboxylate transport system permease small subunit
MVDQIIKITDKTLSCICIFFMTLLLVVVLIGILSRFVLANPVGWSEEFARYFQVWLTFMGAPLAFLTFSHIGIKYLSEALRPQMKILLTLCIYCVIAAFCVFMFLGGIKLTALAWPSKIVSVDMSLGMMLYLGLPISATLIFYVLVLNAISFTENLKKER